ncbi:TetR/AcrR family transcriptional regulator [Sphingobium sp. LB126]|uniref:TetR/AcrR family transcriptional regulator n=1 Tax=Sphingobium sp. LB126 TaxID=1983755 RepID=UPI001F5BBEC5|nr:TetR/AcrR family transcriptional regulator [Sphingobium sp. LB126]
MTPSDTPLMSRREARRRDRRKAIMEVAARSFLTHGYAATTMSSIAAELGGSKGTLWSYFPSKEALFAAVLDEATTAYRAQLAELLDPCGDLRTTLERLGLNLLQKVTSPTAIALNRLVLSEAARFPEIGAIFHEYGPLHTRRLIAEFLERAMTRGLLRTADPLLSARTYTVLLMSGCHQMLMLGLIPQATQEQIAADVAVALDCFMRTYAPDPVTPRAR